MTEKNADTMVIVKTVNTINAVIVRNLTAIGVSTRDCGEEKSMEKLKPCPFCGNKMEGYPDYTVTFRRDKRKVYGVYHEICTIKCNGCGCTLCQAGCGKEGAEKNVSRAWNRRAEHETD